MGNGSNGVCLVLLLVPRVLFLGTKIHGISPLAYRLKILLLSIAQEQSVQS